MKTVLAGSMLLIAALAGAQQNPPVIIPDKPVSCQQTAPLVFYVDARATGGAGTAKAPFATINAAIFGASKAGACYLRVWIARGTYTENVVNVLSHLELYAAAGATLNGSIVGAKNWTDVRGLSIEVRENVGVRQAGGQLQLTGLSIGGALISPKYVDSGIAVWISDGAQATLDLVTLHDNASQALRAEGIGTEVWMFTSMVTNTGINPTVLALLDSPAGATADPNYGAVQITRGAKAIIKWSLILGSEVAGLLVDHSAQVLIKVSFVTGTVSAGPPAHRSGAVNLWTRDNATLETYSLFTRASDINDFAITDGWLTNHGAVVGGAPVGLDIESEPDIPGYSPLICAGLDGTAFTDVGVPLSAPTYSVPGAGDATLCRHVSDDPRPF